MSSADLTQEAWLACNEPGELLRQVGEQLSQRKLRLFACACCQRVWSLLTRAAVHDAVRTAERFADGQASIEDLRAGWLAVRRTLSSTPLHTKWEDALMAALHTTSELMSVYAASHAAESAARARDDTWRQHHRAVQSAEDEARYRCGSPKERIYQSRILRDLVPLRPVVFDPAWSRWQDGVVMNLAQAIYEEERFQDLPVLADALEEAGCSDQTLLAHCRQRGPHARGCWVLDAILALV